MSEGNLHDFYTAVGRFTVAWASLEMLYIILDDNKHKLCEVSLAEWEKVPRKEISGFPTIFCQVTDKTIELWPLPDADYQLEMG
jgi:hypothetical protein